MYGEEKFICPNCGTGTSHHWFLLITDGGESRLLYTFAKRLIDEFDSGDQAMSVCQYCEDYCLWKEGKLIYPVTNILIAEPNSDLPEGIKSIYEEARDIFQYSSRSSAALLRLALENMLSELGYLQNKLVDKINALIDSEGTSQELVMAAEIIRLYGNSSAHAGFIDLNEDKEAAVELFMILNLIAEHKYTRPKRLQALIDKLPTSKKEQVKKKLEQIK